MLKWLTFASTAVDVSAWHIALCFIVSNRVFVSGSYLYIGGHTPHFRCLKAKDRRPISDLHFHTDCLSNHQYIILVGHALKQVLSASCFGKYWTGLEQVMKNLESYGILYDWIFQARKLMKLKCGSSKVKEKQSTFWEYKGKEIQSWKNIRGVRNPVLIPVKLILNTSVHPIHHNAGKYLE